ncbi:ParB N-terminal domain-containing protein [Variovorax sp. IB41]|uniref:ParB N-terminal domain-containing protein n=1 Tax=Variovorax sp. IB41 TaxID=2779370 RepID=UPI0018E6E8E2|nr:ParB N-terminal domain-containing protein [Variovorax sp. IB41]MBJ2155279.1 ParB N-terminal domain-containing protein [Variovorax sp. IB41]
MKSIDIKIIRIDGGTQAREQLQQDVVAEYAEAIKAGEKLPAVVLVFDGSEYWLADGFHRYHASVAAGKTAIQSEILNGTRRSAVLYAVGANREHGLRRSNADKRRAVEMLLCDEEWGSWSDRRIAEIAGVTGKTVAAARSDRCGNSADSKVRKVERGGSVYTQDTTAIGPRMTAIEVEDSGPAAAPPAEKTVVKAAQGSAPASAAPAGQGRQEDADEDHTADFDPFVELQQANDENIKLRQLLDADDKAAEALRWQSAYDVAQRRSDEHLQTIASRDKQIDFLSRQLKRCGKAVGEDDTDKIAPAVERIARAAKVSA